MCRLSLSATLVGEMEDSKKTRGRLVHVSAWSCIHSRDQPHSCILNGLHSVCICTVPCGVEWQSRALNATPNTQCHPAPPSLTFRTFLSPAGYNLKERTTSLPNLAYSQVVICQVIGYSYRLIIESRSVGLPEVVHPQRVSRQGTSIFLFPNQTKDT